MTTILGILTWLTSKKAYLASYADDESAKKVAARLWNSVTSYELWAFVFMLCLTIAFCYYYYFPFNNKPGRHYHLKFWALFYVMTVVFILFGTFFFFLCCAKNSGFDTWLLWRISFMNAAYSFLAYIVCSIMFSRKSNAYPLI